MPADRLSGLDIAFLCIDTPAAPMHMGAVALFDSSGPPDGRRIAALIAERAARVPRLRLRVRWDWPVPHGASWDPDPGFTPDAHVGVHVLPDVGVGDDADPLGTYTSRWLSTPLDTGGPLWQAMVVTGLPSDRFALLLKIHHALTDGAGAAELAFGLLDELPVRVPAPRAPAEQAGGMRALWKESRDVVSELVESAGIAHAVLRAARPLSLPPTAIANSRTRRLGFARLDADDVRRVRRAHGGTTHDVVLAVLSGALRDWLFNTGQRPDTRPMRALIPVSTRRRSGGSGGNALSAYLCSLPVDVDDPVERLSRVTAAMDRNKQDGPTRGAGALPRLAERLPGAVHRLATRTVAHAAPVLFDTVVTTVAVPSLALSLDGAPLHEVYPFVPLAPHQAVGIAVSPFRDAVHIGLQTGGDAVHGVGSLTDAVTKSMATLVQHCL